MPPNWSHSPDTALQRRSVQAGAARIGQDTGEPLALSRPQPRGDAGATRERRALTRPRRAVRCTRAAPASRPCGSTDASSVPEGEHHHVRNALLAWRGVNDPAGAGCGTGSRARGGGRSRPDFSLDCRWVARGRRQRAPPPGARHRQQPVAPWGLALAHRQGRRAAGSSHRQSGRGGGGGQEPPNPLAPSLAPGRAPSCGADQGGEMQVWTREHLAFDAAATALERVGKYWRHSAVNDVVAEHAPRAVERPVPGRREGA